MTALDFANNLSGILWGTPLLVTVLFGGAFFTVITGFFTFRYFGHMLKHTFGSLLKKDESKEKTAGKMSPYQVVAIAVGGTVGVGNIAGVSTAIATGGPGAVFWIWVWALLGMTIKQVEVALACYYRYKDEAGNYYGGPTYYMEKGMGKDHGWSWWVIFAYVFGIGIFAGCISGAQTYTIAESLNTSFGIPMLPFAIVYSIFITFVIAKGFTSVADFATKIVPIMCILYILAGIGIVFVNFSVIPATFALIFKGAFSGTAAIGGFAGVAVAKVIRTGVARSIYSNEAGWGSSPMVHASANTPHPVRQGLWGSFEVFVDTILVCSITALADLTAGEGTVWSSGIAGASLAIKAFETTFGWVGGKFITISVFLFGMTTTTGWFVYYEVLLRQLFRKNPSMKDKVIKGFKIFYVLPGMFNVYLAVSGGQGPVFMWAIADCINAIPTFTNVVVLILLNKTYMKLLRDYKARYLGIGAVDPSFKVFYDCE